MLSLINMSMEDSLNSESYDKKMKCCLKWGNTLPVVSADDEGGKQLPR